MNNISKWLKEQNAYFGTNGFGIYPDINGNFITEDICKNTGLGIIRFDRGYSSLGDFYNQLTNENLLLVSPYNIVDIEIIRPWTRFQFVGNLFPYGSMLPSEVYLDPETDYEWAWKLHTQQVKYQGILDLEDPSKHPFWYAFSKDQKVKLANIHQHIRSTSIKALPRGIRVYES